MHFGRSHRCGLAHHIPAQVLSSRRELPVIPHDVTISKRLAQCLNPALPTGVHKASLEVYQLVFEAIQSHRCSRLPNRHCADSLTKSVVCHGRLQHNMGVWFGGLFTIFPHATPQLQPVILRLYERFMLPLGALRPPLPRHVWHHKRDAFTSLLVPQGRNSCRVSRGF